MGKFVIIIIIIIIITTTYLLVSLTLIYMFYRDDKKNDNKLSVGYFQLVNIFAHIIYKWSYFSHRFFQSLIWTINVKMKM